MKVQIDGIGTIDMVMIHLADKTLKAADPEHASPNGRNSLRLRCILEARLGLRKGPFPDQN